MKKLKRTADITIVLFISIFLLVSCSSTPDIEPVPDHSKPATASSSAGAASSVPGSSINQSEPDTSEFEIDPSKEPPLREADWAIVVPDFLTEEQQLLYRKAYNLYNLFLGESASVDSYPMLDGSSLGFYPIKETINGVEYYMAQGRYRDWDTFWEMVHSVYTDELFELLNQSSSGNPIYLEQNGALFYLDTTYITHPGKLYNETFELVSQTDDEIIFLVSDQFYEEITDSVETQSGFVIMKCIDGKWLVNEFGYPK